MKKGNKKLFLDQEKLVKMLNLRLGGFSVESLAVLFNCDHTSIGDQCRKYGIIPVDSVYPVMVKSREVYDIMRVSGNIISTIKFVDEERINHGKTYAEYLAEAAARKQPEGILGLQSAYPHSWVYKIR